jgi:hypothetical protein
MANPLSKLTKPFSSTMMLKQKAPHAYSTTVLQ